MRAFFIIWLGQALSRLGSQIVQFALIWYLTDKTGSATVLAGASIVGFLPQIALGPLAGTFVDRWDWRKVLVFADGTIALATIVLATLQIRPQRRIDPRANPAPSRGRPRAGARP